MATVLINSLLTTSRLFPWSTFIAYVIDYLNDYNHCSFTLPGRLALLGLHQLQIMPPIVLPWLGVLEILLLVLVCDGQECSLKILHFVIQHLIGYN